MFPRSLPPSRRPFQSRRRLLSRRPLPSGRSSLAARLLLLATLLAATLVPAPAWAAGPTADQLRARIGACETQLSNGLYAHDAGGTRTVRVCGSGGAVYWTADLDVDCDGQRTTQCNENTDPSFQPDTSFHQSDGRALNAAGLPYIVVPLPSSTWDYRTAGIGGGTVVAVAYQDKVVYGVVGDLGPTSAIGEGSYRLAQELGINPNPATGGVSGAVVSYVFFPGVTAVPLESNADAVSKGSSAASDFVSGVQTCASTGLDFPGYPTLRSGSTGAAVKAAQCLLHVSDQPSGTFDTATADAAKAFQTSVGLTADGVIGPKTWTALLSAGDTPVLRSGSTGEPVRRLQRALTAALARTVAIDAQFGPSTAQAVRDYQTTRGLTSDAVVGPATWTALQSGH